MVNPKLYCQGVLISIFTLFSFSNAVAHGELVWNDFTIDNKNDSIAVIITQVRKTIADIILARREVPDWPDRELSNLRDELLHLLEEHELLLNHFKENKINLNSSRQLIANPRAGRSMTASTAMEISIALIEYMASLENQYEFEDDLHENGKGAYMFDLMDAYTDKMGLYSELVKVKMTE